MTISIIVIPKKIEFIIIVTGGIILRKINTFRAKQKPTDPKPMGKITISLLAVVFRFISPPNVTFMIKNKKIQSYSLISLTFLSVHHYSSRFLSSFSCFSVHRWRKFSIHSHFDPLQKNALFNFVFAMNDSQYFSTSDSSSITTVDPVISSLSLFFIHHLKTGKKCYDCKNNDFILLLIIVFMMWF